MILNLSKDELRYLKKTVEKERKSLLVSLQRNLDVGIYNEVSVLSAKIWAGMLTCHKIDNLLAQKEVGK